MTPAEAHWAAHAEIAADVAATRKGVENLEQILGNGNGLVGRFRRVEIKVAVMAAILGIVGTAGGFVVVFAWNEIWKLLSSGG